MKNLNVIIKNLASFTLPNAETKFNIDDNNGNAKISLLVSSSISSLLDDFKLALRNIGLPTKTVIGLKNENAQIAFVSYIFENVSANQINDIIAGKELPLYMREQKSSPAFKKKDTLSASSKAINIIDQYVDYIDDELITNLQSKEFTKKHFGIPYAFFILADQPVNKIGKDTNGYMRYRSKIFRINHHSYYMTNYIFDRTLSKINDFFSSIVPKAIDYADVNDIDNDVKDSNNNDSIVKNNINVNNNINQLLSSSFIPSFANYSSAYLEDEDDDEYIG